MELNCHDCNKQVTTTGLFKTDRQTNRERDREIERDTHREISK